MKKLLLLLIALPLLLNSCKDDDNQYGSVDLNGIYVINYGNYNGVVGSVSSFNPETEVITNNAYETVNRVTMSGNSQYAYIYNDKIYFMNNALDEVFYIDANNFHQTKNGISKDIVKPRYCVGDGDYLYISCWGGDVWTDASVSYIAKFNINTNAVEEKIALPDGPEGLIIIDNKLYCALNYTDKVAVVDLDTEEISYIEGLGGVGTYFEKDSENNLYLAVCGSYSVATTREGMAYINTQTNQLADFFPMTNVSQNYGSIFEANTDASKLYILATTYDENWNLSGAVRVFDTATKTFDQNLVEGIEGLQGININPNNNDIYVLSGTTAISIGTLTIYNENKELKGTYSVGTSPYRTIFAE